MVGIFVFKLSLRPKRWAHCDWVGILDIGKFIMSKPTQRRGNRSEITYPNIEVDLMGMPHRK